MKVEDILDRKNDDIITIDISHNLRAAADLMMLKRIAALVVMDGSRVVGMLSERDLVLTIAEKGPKAAETPIRDIVSDSMLTIAPEESLKRAMAVMTAKRTRHLPVFADADLVGIVSLGDLVKYRLEEVEMETNVLRDLAIAIR